MTTTGPIDARGPLDPTMDLGIDAWGSSSTSDELTAERMAEAVRARGTEGISFEGMSGNQILAFMSTVMRNLDHDLAARADVLQRRNEESKALSEEIAILERISSVGKKDGDTTVALWEDGAGMNRDEVGGQSVRDWLASEGRSDVLDFLGDEPARLTSTDAFDQRIADLKSRQNEISSNSEMDMIGFQSMVQTRQMFVNLATQMMSSEHDAQNNVVRNIG